MFRTISYKIASQFTLFVFILFMVNGALFLVADFTNARRQSQMRLSRTLQLIVSQPVMMRGDLPAPIRERVRIIDTEWKPVFSGGIFQNVPVTRSNGFSLALIEGDQYGIYTAPVMTNGELGGYIQVADLERFQRGDLPLRAAIYLLVSAFISLLTYIVGLFFARTSLKPADRMMQNLEQFTQDASHELRTPLAMLNSSLDLALKNQQYKEGIVSAKEDVKHVSMLVEKLLDLARLDAFTLQRDEVDLTGLVTQTLEKYQNLAAEKGVTIKTLLADNVRVDGDAALIRQIIGNLLSNAIKFNKPKGIIEVKLQKKSLSISDTGVGIDPQDLPKVFNRFYQGDTSRAKEGFGLGLSIVKRIVEIHRWTIDVRSTKGKNTIFTITFE